MDASSWLLHISSGMRFRYGQGLLFLFLYVLQKEKDGLGMCICGTAVYLARLCASCPVSQKRVGGERLQANNIATSIF